MTRPPFTPELLARVFRNIRAIVTVLVIPPAIALALPEVLHMVPEPVYRAEARLTIQLGENAQGASPSKIDMPSEIDRLRSSAGARVVLSRLGIPAVLPDIASSDPSAEEKAIVAFGERLDVQPAGPGNAVHISFEAENSDIAIKALETLIADFEAGHAAPAAADPAGTDETAPIEREIAEKQKQLQDLTAQRDADDGTASSSQRAALNKRRDEANADLQDAEGKRDVLQKKIDTLKQTRAETPKFQTLKDDDVEPVTPPPSPTLTRLMALRREELQLLQKYPPTSPEVQKLHAEISVAEKVTAMELAEAQALSEKTRTVPNPKLAEFDLQIGSAEADLAALVSRIDGDRKKIADLDSQLDKLQGAERQSGALQQRIDEANAELQALRVKLDMAKASGTVVSGAPQAIISVTEAPHLVSQPSLPQAILSELAVPDRAFLLRVGLGIGAALALFIILVSLLSRRTILTAEGAERILEMPVVAAIPRLKRMHQAGKTARSPRHFYDDPPLSR
jgi:hypothetical protein